MEPQLSPADLLGHAMELYAAGDLEALGRLVHPDAEIQMAYLQGASTAGPTGLEDTLAEAAGSIHHPWIERIVQLDDHAAVSVGRVRYPIAGGGFGDRSAAWLAVFKDGLIWRVTMHGDVAEAKAAYESAYAPTVARLAD